MTRQLAAHPLAGSWTDLRQSELALRSFQSDLLGVCREVVEITYSDDDVRSFYTGAGASTSVETLGFPCNTENGGGAFNKSTARNAAIGETVERYSATYQPNERLTLDTARALGSAAVRPEEFAFFSARQYDNPDFAYARFEEDMPVRWVEGLDLRTHRAVMLPAQVCFLSGRRAPGEPRITYSTSNGLACGPTRREATASGFLELVERDPLMIAWHGGLSFPRIDLAADPVIADVVRRHFDPTGLEMSAVDLSSVLGIPTVVGVVRNHHSDVGALALGAASRPTIQDATVEALLEAFQTRTWCRTQQLSQPRLADHEIQTIGSFEQHVRLYGERDRAQLADFLTASTEIVDPRDADSMDVSAPSALVADMLQRIPEDIDVYAVDLTSPDVADAGLSVVKVYSPQLQPLDVGWTARFLGGSRIYRVPFELGMRDRHLTEDDLTPVPHPFP